MLQLVTWLGFEAHGLFTRPHFAFGLDVSPKRGAPARIAHLSDFMEYHFGIPDIFGQPNIDVLHERAEFFHSQSGLARRRRRITQIPSDGALGTADLGGNIDNVSALMAHMLYHEKILSAQHVEILFGVGTIRKQHVGWSGQIKW